MNKPMELEMPYDPKKSEDEWFAKHEREMLELSDETVEPTES
jgi:hypothetical protein